MINLFTSTEEDPIGFRVTQHTIRRFKGFSKNEETFDYGGTNYL
jgi:hypothetical protein